ncbi:MAG: cytochrome c biogenesis protein CcsA [Oligoflexia bacterium]|nr:cytochrome c biogenesis protein CcsA [Oligoflexia bacterium]
MNLLLLIIIFLWIKVERPPIKTLGETRLWYAFFLSSIGLILDKSLSMRWCSNYSICMSIIFLFIDFIKPYTFDKELAPALQSIWFIPHVIVYILSYALLAATSLFAFRALFLFYFKNNNIIAKSDDQNTILNNLINEARPILSLGLALLTLGLIFGAIWAKTAWGHYWTWDPEETWALLTWLTYVIYYHLDFSSPTTSTSNKVKTFYLAFNFVILLICWFDVNYLPTAQFSVHTYSN